MLRPRPRVSIGMPVRNGEPYLTAAIESLLSQTFDDFELIVCDNASTDGTEVICRRFAAQDPRVRYYRNDNNLGAARNFNLCYYLARGELFKWAASDDVCAPEFLASCVAALDANPDAVLAYPRAVIIDQDGREIEPYTLKLPTDDRSVWVRYGALLRGHKCFEVFGVIRKSALAKTTLIVPYSHGDGILLARLGLLGRFVEVDNDSFRARRHAAQSMTMLAGSIEETDYVSYAVWFDPNNAGRALCPYWRMLIELAKAIHSAPMSLYERYRCYKKLVDWVLRRRSLLLRDLKLRSRRRRGVGVSAQEQVTNP